MSVTNRWSCFTRTSKANDELAKTRNAIRVQASGRMHAEDNGGGQDAESKAMDATATQWSFQFAYQAVPDYYDDIVNGQPRRAGLDNYVGLG